jgi:hypothetical protein
MRLIEVLLAGGFIVRKQHDRVPNPSCRPLKEDDKMIELFKIALLGVGIVYLTIRVGRLAYCLIYRCGLPMLANKSAGETHNEP